MKRYTVTIDLPAQKQLRAVKDKRLRDALERDIHALADDPRPPGCLKLAGHKDHWRVRAGDWRIVYRIEDGRLVVVVVRVAVRGGVYR